MKKYKKGYTSGVYDLLHVGHLNVLKHAKELCDYLIVGVFTDEAVFNNKHIVPTICFKDRAAIVESIKYVDMVLPQTWYDGEGEIKTVSENNIDVVFVDSDYLSTDSRNRIERELKKIGCDVLYLLHTDDISPTTLRKKMINEDK